MSGLGLLNSILGGIMPFSIAKTVFIKPASPDAPLADG
jgi:hypothetical protein